MYLKVIIIKINYYGFIMITCKLLGGLGNQLFIIFSCLSYAIEHKQVCLFENTEKTLGMTNRRTYWNSFFNKLIPYLVKKKYISDINIIIKEKDYFNKFNREKHILLNDYFQSDKYFKNNYTTIIKILDIENKKNVILANNKLYSKKMISRCISIHFRIGDFLHIPDFHNILPLEYYKNAIELILENIDYIPIFLYFCEDTDLNNVKIIIASLKCNFNYLFLRADNTLQDWEQLLLMSCCKHNIIANSTFSWWGAYFNSYTEKIVCYPAIWFGPKNNYNIVDLFPEKWNKIEF